MTAWHTRARLFYGHGADCLHPLLRLGSRDRVHCEKVQWYNRKHLIKRL